MSGLSIIDYLLTLPTQSRRGRVDRVPANRVCMSNAPSAGFCVSVVYEIDQK